MICCCIKLLEWHAEKFSSVRKWLGKELISKVKNSSYLKSIFVMMIEHIIDTG